MDLKWRTDVPRAPGLYLYVSKTEWAYRPYAVTHGSWQLGQNPQFLYANNLRLASFGIGQWLGPLPEVEKGW